MISIQKENFSVEEIIGAMKVPKAGAVVSFLGIVRKDPEVSVGLEVEAYEEMALKKLERVVETAKERFEIEDLSIVHRIGTLAIGENITLVATSAAHRSDAFAATRWVIEELKRAAPLWKREI
ncbi:MAG: molybdenum cofactor biosynthesis protein MoaE [Thermoplasmata archaeon]